MVVAGGEMFATSLIFVFFRDISKVTVHAYAKAVHRLSNVVFTTTKAFDGVDEIVGLAGDILPSPVTTFVLEANDFARSVQSTAYSACSIGAGSIGGRPWYRRAAECADQMVT